MDNWSWPLLILLWCVSVFAFLCFSIIIVGYHDGGVAKALPLITEVVVKPMEWSRGLVWFVLPAIAQVLVFKKRAEERFWVVLLFLIVQVSFMVVSALAVITPLFLCT